MWEGNGFSALELLIVLAILGIFAACAWPQLAAWEENADCRKAAREIVSMLRDGRSRAVASDLEHRVEVKLEDKLFRLTHGNRSISSTETSWDNNVVIDWLPLPVGGLRADADCAQDTGVVKIHFNPAGTANSQYLCILDDAGKPRFQVGVGYSTTGRISVKQWNPADHSWK